MRSGPRSAFPGLVGWGRRGPAAVGFVRCSCARLEMWQGRGLAAPARAVLSVLRVRCVPGLLLFFFAFFLQLCFCVCTVRSHGEDKELPKP